jgi:hypothetical protein
LFQSSELGPSSPSVLCVVFAVGGFAATNGAWRDSELYSILVHEWNVHA